MGKKLMRDFKYKNDTPQEVAKQAYVRAKKTEEEYKAAVIFANDAQRSFRKETSELKTVVHAHFMRRAMQEINFMGGVSSRYKEHLDKNHLNQKLDEFDKLAKALDASDIVQETYQSIIESHGEDPDIRTEFRVEYKGWKNAFFSLQDALVAHETDGDVPKMLEVLCEKTKELGGLQ